MISMIAYRSVRGAITLDGRRRLFQFLILYVTPRPRVSAPKQGANIVVYNILDSQRVL
jgi:hypothetical protein